MKAQKYFFLTVILLLLNYSSYSQEWFFGINCGLDFSGGAPVFLAGGQTVHQEGVVVQYDCNDDLTFYSNGIDVWDDSHAIIPGGPLSGSFSMTQNLAIPKPGSDGNTYYLFYGIPPDAVQGAEIMWAEIDMTVPTIASKDNAMPVVGGAIFYEGMTLVAHANGTDYWLVLHRGNSNRFDFYMITAAGIAWNRSQNIGTNFVTYNPSQVGYMATSKNNDRIACANASTGSVQAFSFNNTTGVIALLRTFNFGANGWSYGVDFSPNGLYLYVGKRAAPNAGIAKLNIGTGGGAYIHAPAFASGGVRRGPDDKLYFVDINTTWVGVINNPDNYAAPNLNANAVSTAPNNVQDGLPTLPVDPICIVPLPIELVSFTTNENKGRVELNWVTASEEVNDYFTIERSKDAFNWEELGRVPGMGTTSQSTKYNFIDENPLLGTSYYRLKQTDYNGKSETFNVEVVQFNQKAEVYMVNTDSRKVAFYANIEREDVAMLEIYNILGERVARQSMELKKGSKIYEMPNQNFTEGVYILQIKTTNGLAKSLKFKF